MANNALCGLAEFAGFIFGTFTTEGIAMLAEAFGEMPQLSSLKCACSCSEFDTCVIQGAITHLNLPNCNSRCLQYRQQ